MQKPSCFVSLAKPLAGIPIFSHLLEVTEENVLPLQLHLQIAVRLSRMRAINPSTQHIAMILLGAGNMLRAFGHRVAMCCDTCVATWSHLSQQHPTCACRNRVAKRAQHVAPNNVATCCVGTLRSFGRGFT